VNREEFCQNILNIDDKIRFVAIYHEGEFYHKYREGLKSPLTKNDTEDSLKEAVYRWSSRQKMRRMLGAPVFAMAKYEQMYRISIPLGKEGLILASMELGVDLFDIVNKVIEIRNQKSSVI